MAALPVGSMVLPIRVTAIVGLKLLQRLVQEYRLPSLPQVIYLDAAHEYEETMQELWAAWNTLSTDGGVLYGDDWNWPAVRRSVADFASCLRAHIIDVRGTVSAMSEMLQMPASGQACRQLNDSRTLPPVTFGEKVTARYCFLHREVLIFKNQWVIVKAQNEEAGLVNTDFCNTVFATD